MIFYFFWHDKYILTWQKNHHHHDHHDPDFQPKTLELHKLTPYMGGVPYPINVFVMIFYFFWHDKYILTWQKNHHHDHHDNPDFQPKTLELHKLTPYMGGVPCPINVFVIIFYFFLA